MLSILIPIYNFEVVKLVDKLHKDCTKAKIPFEILCYDDGSENKYKRVNSVLASYFAVNYTELSKNLGRAKIRNWLAKTSSYDNLLFLDCDSKVSGRNFIKNYISQIGSADIVSGGRHYGKKAPRAKSKRLHWSYGKYRESKPASFRNKHPYLFFHSNNFMVKKKLITQFKFDENVKGYGYEDLLFAERLKANNIKIKHINNPVEHLGLEKAKIFLNKTCEAIDNLLTIKYKERSLNTRLERAAEKLQDSGFHEDFLNYYKKRQSKIESNLLSDNPKIRNLDWFKLNYYYTRRSAWIQGEF